MSTELIAQIESLIEFQKIGEKLINTKSLFQKITENLKNLTSDSLIGQIEVKRSDGNIIESIDNSELKNSFNCLKCRFKTHFQSVLRRHESIHSNEKLLKCNKCKKRFRYLNHLKVHQLVHNSAENRFKRLVKRKLNRKTAKRVENLNLISDSVIDEIEIYRSEDNFIESIDNSELKNIFNCLKCRFKTRFQSVLRRHELIHSNERLLKCNKCKKRFRYLSDLKVHQLVHKRIHSAENPIKILVKQRKLNQKTAEKFEILEFISDLVIDEIEVITICHTSDDNINESMKGKNTYFKPMNEKQFECKDCDKTFGQSECLKRHQLIHTNEKPFKCDKCVQQFRYSSYLKTHQLIHSNEKPFECKDCKKSFRQIQHLRGHQLIHSNEMPYNCDKCGKQFRQLSHLKRHHSFHRNERQFVCDWIRCGKRFNVKSDLNRHKRLVHLKERQFECDYKDCGKGFTSEYYLNEHKRIHSGEKPFVCDNKNCDKRFTYKSYLKQHIKRIHSKQN